MTAPKHGRLQDSAHQRLTSARLAVPANGLARHPGAAMRLPLATMPCKGARDAQAERRWRRL